MILVVVGALQGDPCTSPLQALGDSAAWWLAAPGRLGLLAPGAALPEDRSATSISHNSRGERPPVGGRVRAISAWGNSEPQRALCQRGQGPVVKACPHGGVEGRLETGPIANSFKPTLELGGTERCHHMALSKPSTTDSQDGGYKRGTWPATLPDFRPMHGCEYLFGMTIVNIWGSKRHDVPDLKARLSLESWFGKDICK